MYYALCHAWCIAGVPELNIYLGGGGLIKNKCSDELTQVILPADISIHAEFLSNLFGAVFSSNEKYLAHAITQEDSAGWDSLFIVLGSLKYAPVLVIV